MKMKLPKALLIAVLAGAAAAVAAPRPYVTSDTFDSTTTNVVEKLQNGAYDGTSNDTPKVIVKVGQDTVTVSENIVLNNPLVVREGTLEFSNSAMASQKTKLSSAVSNLLVGGTNAHLILTNAQYNQNQAETNNYVSAVGIGTADGAGTVTLQQGSVLHTDHFVFAGYKYISNGYVSDTTKSPTDTSLYNAEGKDPGRSKINIKSQSTLSVGQSFQFANVDVTIDGDKSNMTDNTEGLTGSKCGYPYSYFGGTDDLGTVIKVTNGGDLNMNWNVWMGYDANAKTDVSIDGTGSSFNIAYKAYFGKEHKYSNGYNGATANISITNGAKADWGYVEANEGTTITVDKKSSIVGHKVDGANLIVLDKYKDSEEVDHVDVSGLSKSLMVISKGATVDNAGTIAVDTIMTGGQFIAKDGSSMASLEATGGEFQVGGSIDAWGDIALTNAEFIFADGAVIDLNGNDFTFDEGSSITIIMSELETQLVMLADADSTYEIQGITFNNAGSVTGLDDDLTVTLLSSADADPENAQKVTLSASKVTVNPVPEPTTATLSLLALAGLAARRRRK